MTSVSADFLLGGSESCAMHVIQDTSFRMEWMSFIFAKNSSRLRLKFTNAINWLYSVIEKIKNNYVNRRLGSCVDRVEGATQKIQLFHLRETFLFYILGNIFGLLLL